MSLLGFQELFQTADELRPGVGVAAAGGADVTVLQALSQAAARGWVRPILTGDAVQIAEAARQAEVPLDRFSVVDSPQPADAAAAAVAAGEARLLMKGKIDTPALVRALLDPRHGLRSGRTVCQVVLMEIVNQKRRFLLADTGVTIRPTLDQKLQIIRSTIDVARALGAAEPRVALAAATEKMNPDMPETVEIAELCRRASAGAFPGAIVQGPLSFDLAYASDAGEKKRIEGDVVGAADALVFPDLLSANLTVKGIMYTADCRFGGVLAGARCPVVFMSRADSTETRLHSLALALAVERAA